MRSLIRLLAAGAALATVCLVRPSAADMTDNMPRGVSGEGELMFGEPDPRTGAMTQGIPIQLPAARGLPQPRLSLRYVSSSRDREAGYGWGLELPTIERRPLSGFPTYDYDGYPTGDERYTFGGKLLVKICVVPSCPSEANTEGHPDWATGWSYYRLQIDGSSTRFYRSPEMMTWRVQMPSGERLELGRLLADTGVAGAVPDAVEWNYEDTGLFRWRLVGQIDPQHPKNVVVYRWEHAAPHERRNLLFLKDVFFTPAVADVTNLAAYAHHVQLDWESPAYPVTNYLGPERATLPVRLTRIAVASMPWDTSGDPARRLVRAYHLRYLANRSEAPYDPTTTAPLFHHSFLREVQLEGRCEEGVETAGQVPAGVRCPVLPPTRFEYSPGFLQTFAATHSTLLGGPPNAEIEQQVFPYPDDVAVVDFNRDGLPDVVQGWEAPDPPMGDWNQAETKVAITPEGDPQLWFRHAIVYRHDTEDPNDDEVAASEEWPLRSARPILGYLNRGRAPGGGHQLGYQCMDAGSTLTAIANGDPKARLFNRQGSTVVTSAGNAVAFWQAREQHFPLVARPIALPTYGPGTEPSNFALGGCFLDGQFDKNNFFPRWSWEPEIDFAPPGGEFVRRSANTVKASATWDLFTNAEPAWIVDIDGDGLPDRLVENDVAGWDLYRARVFFTRYYSKTDPPPTEASGAGAGPALVPFVKEDAVSLMPARRVRAGIPNGPPGPPSHFWYTDINGDGITDFVMVSVADGVTPRVRPGNGRGRFACTDVGEQGAGCLPNTDTSAPLVPDYFDIEVISATKPWDLYSYLADPYRFQFHDVTGDGLADIVFWKDGIVYLWTNLDGRRFACVGDDPVDPCRIGAWSLPPGAADWSSTRVSLRFADMNADGVDDIVAVFKSGIEVVQAYRGPDLAANAQAPRPGLLVKIHNGRGATTSIEYRSIQDLDAAAAQDGAPWTHHSPVVDHVVTRVTVEDAAAAAGGAHPPSPFWIARDVSYTYREPAYDRWKRQFVGFRSVASKTGGEQAITETTYWYGPCERDDVYARPLNGAPPATTRCAAGSDDETAPETTFRALVGKPVRTDRYLPNGEAREGRRYLWSKFITYAPTNWLVPSGSADHEVVAKFVAQIETHHYDASAPTTAGAVDQVTPEGDPIEHPPVQSGAKVIRRTFDTLPETGQVHTTTDYGDEAGGDVPVRTESYAVATRDWQYLPQSTPVSFDSDHSGGFATLARDNSFEFDARGDLIGIDANPGGDPVLDRSHEGALATAPTPSHSAWWARLAEIHYDPETGVLDEVRGAPWTAMPQRCTRYVLDERYHELPRSVIEFKNGCDSPDPLETVLSFDRGFGVPVARTGPDLGVSLVELDAFGRPTAVAAPDPAMRGFTELTETIAYGDQEPLSYVDVSEITSNFPTPSSIRHVILLNGVGEQVLTFSEDEGGAWIASGWTEREAGGKVARMRRPFGSTQDPLAVAGTAQLVGIPGGGATGYFDQMHDGFGRVWQVKENGEPILEKVFYPLAIETRDKEQISGSHVGSFHRVESNGRGQPTRVIDRTSSTSISTTITYDGLGQPLQVTKSDGASAPFTRSMVYDMLGRLTENDEPNTSRSGRHWRYVYDDAGNLVGTSDARGCGKNLYYDGLGRLIGEDYSPCLSSHSEWSEPAPGQGLEVEYRYDDYEADQMASEPGFAEDPSFARGRLVSVRDRGSHTRFNYDGRGRLRRTSRRVAKPSSFAPLMGDRYSAHWLAQRTDFDVAGRLTSKTSGADLPELLVGGGSAESYSYSARGAVQRIDSSYGLLIDHIAYEPDGQPSLIRYGDLARTETTFSYDAQRRLQFMTTQRVSPVLWSTGPFTAGYPQPTWRTTQTSLANIELRYDGVGNPTEIFDYADPDQYRHEDKLPVYRRGMRYDDLYRVTRVDYHYNPAASPAGFRSPYLPEVNAGDTRPVPLQLQLSTRVAQQSFDYDFLGNTTSTSDDLGATYDRSLGAVTHGSSTDGPNQLRSANGIEASYDAAGNITELRVQRQGDCISGGVNRCAQWFAYEWDEVGQLAKARRWDFDTLPVVAPGEGDAPAWSLTYAYSQGARVLKSSKDAAGIERHTLEVFDTLRFERAAFVEQDEDYERHRDNVHVYLGGGVGHVIYDSNYELPNLGSPIHRLINIGDHLGSSNVTIDGDTSELVERATHQAFGAIESDYRPDRWKNAREPYKFTGKEEDIEVGLTYFGARYYQPHLGRWASADPLTIHGLGADLNPYAYVGGRVMSHVDPNGLCVEPSPDGPTGGCPAQTPSDGVAEVTVHGTPRPATDSLPSTPPYPDNGAGMEVAARQLAIASEVLQAAGDDGSRTAQIFKNAVHDARKALGQRPAAVSSVPRKKRIADGEVPPAEQLDVFGIGDAVAPFPRDRPSDTVVDADVTPTIFKVAVVAPRGAPPALPAALEGGVADTHVYVGTRNGANVYVGITNDLNRRQAQHGARFVLRPITDSALTRGEARAVEQALKVRNPGFENIRNSISPNHPWYNDAVEWGEWWLDSP